METLILSPHNNDDIKKAGEILKNGGLVAIPTETVYGLAANALDETATEKIYTAKGRPSDNPLIVHVSKIEDIAELVTEIPPKAKALAEKFWPGPLTIILPKSDKIPSKTSGGLNTVAIRIPNNKVALDIIKESAVPLAAPSSNLSGRPSPTCFEHVFEDMNGRIDAIIKGKECEVGLESTVITLATNTPKILRPGRISHAEIEKVIGKTDIDSAVLSKLETDCEASSPGMKYKHYAPKAEITISKLSFYDYKILLENDKTVTALCFENQKVDNQFVTYGKEYDSISQARTLFSALHKLDELGCQKVYATCPKQTGVGLAVYNRLIRAASFRIIEPKVQIIGLTGTTGSGKSTVCKILAENFAKIIDCDKITKDPDTYNAKCLKDLQNAFGSDILKENILDRKLLAKRAFESTEKTKLLNQITLPVITDKINTIIENHKNDGAKLIVLDAPTLFEANADKFCTGIMVVTATKNLRLSRIIKRDNLTHTQAMQRINAQKSEDFYTSKADWLIDTENGVNIDKIKEIVKSLKGV
ncbi:MAG: L-threonylcarbamoyladenylate synthase [Clostridia bacterium]